MVTVMSTPIAIMDANISIPSVASINNLQNGIQGVLPSTPRTSAVSVPNEEKPETSTAVRSVAMSVNIANSVKNEVTHLIRVDSSAWDLETMANKSKAKYVEQMANNVNMARSSCSHILPEQNENIILAIVLSKWDDIMGPQTLHVWLKDNASALECNEDAQDKHVCYHEKDAFLMKAIKYVTCHTVNFMAVNSGNRANTAAMPIFHERNTSLFVIPDLEIVVQSVTFSIRDHELSVPCSLALVVRDKHYEYFLHLRKICQLWLRRLTHQLHLILAVTGVHQENDFVTSGEMARWMTEFNLMLISLGTCGLGLPRPARAECDAHVLDYAFIEQALASHLQTRGCSVVMGTSATSVNAMIEFLALFLTPEELFSSRLVHPSHKYSFHTGLYLQGLLLDEFGCRQLSPDELSASPHPVTAIDLTRASSSCAVKQSVLRQTAGTTTSSVFTTSDNRRSSSKLVRGLLADLKQLPTDHWKELVELFMSKVEALSRTLLNLARRTGRGHVDGLETRCSEIQKQFSLVMELEEADFLIVQAAAEKLEPGSFADIFNSEPTYR